MSLKALLCGAMLLFSALLVPLNPNQYFPDAYAQKQDEPREKKDKDPKIDSGTLNKRNQALAKKEAASAASAEDIRVVLELDGSASSSDVKELTKLGIKIEGERETMIQALVPSDQLDVVAKLDFIKYISQPLYVVPALISEGAFVIGANETNAAGFTGQDIKVAVIDVGFDLDNPEIAPNMVEAISFRADGDIQTSDPRHGTAVAEIIVDVAPDVQLFLYNVDTGLSLLNALDFVANQQEVDIVSMSLGIYNAGPYDGTSEISQAVDAVRDSGILFVNAAGNDAQRHWEGNFVDPDSNGLLNFSGADETIGINAQAGQFVQVFLSWDDWPISMQDYDLYVFDDESLVTFSENPQILGFPPTEYAEFVATSTGTYHIAISKFSATQDVTFDLFTTVNLDEYNVPSSSIAIPADAAGAFTVGAVFWESEVLEPFSSRGPTNDGRTKPDITGPDGVTTSAYSPTAFFGTSAATPYVSAAAALVKDMYPSADADALQSLLEENTLNNHVKNNDDGTGMVYMTFLLTGIPVANAGADQTVNETSTVILNGTLSTDSDGTIVSYLWEQVNGTIAVALTDANSPIASFTAPAVTADVELVFKLTVTDDLGASASDEITITVKNVNQAPVANAGLDQIVNEGSTVTMNATASTDPDGDSISYLWTQTNGTSVELDDNTSATPSFTAPEVGADGDTLTFQLTVTDSGGLTDTDTVDIIVENVNVPPVAEAGPDQTVNEGSLVTLNGTASNDFDGDSLTFSWTQIFGPPVTLSGADTATPSFIAPEVDSAGDILTFELTVSDGIANSTDTVNVFVDNVDTNQSPVADAGADQTVDEGAIVTLNGTGSSDSDGDTLTYSWVQTVGPPVILNDSSSATPSFTAPEVDSSGATLTFELTVTDNGGLTSTDTVDVIVQNINQPPIADAGSDQVIDEGVVVTLDGTNSSDPDGDTLLYSWAQTNGLPVILNDPTSPTPSFTAPEVDSAGAVLTFELTVDDGNGGIATDTVDIIVQNVNQAPIADAGTDVIVEEGDVITLSGTGSSDPDGDPLTYSWVQISGTPVELINANTATPSFTAPEVGADGDTLIFELTVSDSGGLTDTDTVSVVVQNVNQPPIANAGSDQTVDEGTIVTLDGTSSSDPDGDALTFSWLQIAGPEVSLDDASSPTPSFTAPEVDSNGAILTFELTVDDANGGIATDSVNISVNNVEVNQAPIADAGPDQTVDEGTLVNLNGTGSNDPDGDTLTYSWVQTSGPAVTLLEADTATPSFTAPLVDSLGTTLTFELTVDDGNGGTDTDSVNVIVQNINQSPIADAGLDQEVDEGTIVILNGTASSDPDGDPISFSWMQTAGPPVTLSGADTATPSFIAPEVDSAGATLTFELTVSDDSDGIATDSVDVVVNNILVSPIADAGTDQVVNEGVVVVLDGSGSTDADGNIESYSWTQINGTSVELLGADTATPSFTAPEVDSSGATLTFELTVTDNDGLTDTDIVNVVVQNVNQPPIANAGSDQTVDEGTIVTLNGTGSSDSDGDPLTFSWTQINGTLVDLDDPASPTPSFTAPLVDSLDATLTFELTVDDGNGGSATDSVDVIVQNVNQPPVADAGSDQVVDEGTVVTLNGTGSSDPDNELLAYSWIQISGTLVELTGADTATPSFTAPEVDSLGVTLIFELTITDNDGLTNADTVNVVVQNINKPPEADAGPDQVVDEGTLVTLDGTGSTDPDGDILGYSWVQTAGPAVILSDSTSPTPSFTTPQVNSTGAVLTFELTISDGADSSTDTVNISIQNVNQPPTANAGPDQIVDESTIVILDGTASSDADGDTLAYSWVQSDGTLVVMSDPTSPSPSFTAPDVGADGDTLTFELTVSDGAANSTDSIDIIIQNINQPPVANAGADQTIDEGDIVTLNGAGSSDPDGDLLTYSWVQIAGPILELLDSDTATPSFTAPEVDSAGAVLTFELTVDDGNGGNATDTVDITVNNVPVSPVADAGSDQVVEEGTLVTLNGTGSSNSDGTIESYSWIQTSGTSVELTGADTATPSFTAPEVGSSGATLTFELNVTDSFGLSSTDTVSVIVQDIDQPPVADAGSDQVVDEGALVTLNGTDSSDPDGDILSYSWTQTAGPAVELLDSDTATPSFIAPAVDSVGAILTFELTVSDPNSGNATDTVDIIVNNVLISPVANAGPSQIVNEGTLVILDGTASSDSDGEIVSYSWVQTGGTLVELDDPTSATPSFLAPEAGAGGDILMFELTVTDNDGLTGTDTVSVVVPNVNQAPTANAGPDQTVNEGTVVVLDGSDSTDQDGTIVGYSWLQESGPSVSLSNASAGSTTFLAPLVDTNTILTFTLNVTDNDNSSATDTVVVTVNNLVAVSSGGGGGGGGSVAPTESTTTLPATFFALNPLAKIIMQIIYPLNWPGVGTLESFEGQQVQASSMLINQQQVPQDYVYIVQITDDNGFTVEIITQYGTATAGETVQVWSSWTPPATGIYNIDIFVWDSLTEAPVPLSNVGHRTITVK